MKHQTLRISAAGGIKLYAQRWLPEGPTKGHLLLVHGYAEHSGRYLHVANRFVEKGYAVYAYDHRGHGQSPGKRAYIERFELLLKDLSAMLDWVRSEAKKEPVFLFGHSMGGAIVTLYCASRKPNLNGVILTGPALKLSDDISPLLQRLSGIVGKYLPTLKTIRLNPEHMSRDKEVVRQYVEDPLTYSGPTYARTGAELVRATELAQRELKQFDLPVLIMHGALDKVVDPESSRMLHRSSISSDKTIKLFDDSFHELLNEPNKEEVMQAMLDWMNDHLGDPSIIAPKPAPNS